MAKNRTIPATRVTDKLANALQKDAEAREKPVAVLVRAILNKHYFPKKPIVMQSEDNEE